MDTIRLGVIGLSEGNGHPYSWSAIFNGYNENVMRECPFPAISEYLFKQKFPEDAISEGMVTHIWTQNNTLSKHIANATNIENVVDNYIDMIGNVDAILLARDDYEMHYEISEPFIKAGLPIYIDKPLTINRKKAEEIFSLEQYNGQIFTCSAIGYAKEFAISHTTLKSIGPLEYVDACVMKSWAKYSVHIIEPVINIIGDQGRLIDVSKSKSTDKSVVTVSWESGLKTTFTTLGDTKCPIKIRLFGKNGYKELLFEDTFYAFKKSLQTFINIIQKKERPLDKAKTLNIIDIIEKGS